MVNKDELYKALNEGVLSERLRRYERNLERNMPLIKRHGGVRKIVGDFSGKHVVVIGAGPSLDKNLHLLKKFQHRRECVFVSADMALKPLIRGGVRPGYVFSCETVPVDYFGRIETGAMRLVAFSCISHVNLRRWSGDISFYNWMMQGGEYDALWSRAGTDLGFVATGNIVTTQAVAFALGCGISSLLLVGNDLGFRERYYSRGTASWASMDEKRSRFTPFESIEYSMVRFHREYEVRRGELVYFTNSQFLAAKLWLEDLFRKTDVPVYDCGEPGCSETAVRRAEAAEYFSRFDRIHGKRGRR